MAKTEAIKYRAFLSYSHKDKAWGKRLHLALEGYRLDKDLIGRATPVGLVPKSLRPIFRDREDFSAGHRGKTGRHSPSTSARRQAGAVLT